MDVQSFFFDKELSITFNHQLEICHGLHRFSRILNTFFCEIRETCAEPAEVSVAKNSSLGLSETQVDNLKIALCEVDAIMSFWEHGMAFVKR